MSEWAAREVQCAADSSSGLEGVAGPGKEKGEGGGIREHDWGMAYVLRCFFPLCLSGGIFFLFFSRSRNSESVEDGILGGEHEFIIQAGMDERESPWFDTGIRVQDAISCCVNFSLNLKRLWMGGWEWVLFDVGRKHAS
jgi:hypothetical protein